jgi:hypothetical protein
MKIFYANENYTKYGKSGMNYFMALMMATFYIMITGFMILGAIMAIYPNVYRHYLIISPKIPNKPSGILILSAIFFLLRTFIKEDSLKDDSLTKEYVKKAINYLILYAFSVGAIFIFIGLKFLRHYQ